MVDGKKYIKARNMVDRFRDGETRGNIAFKESYPVIKALTLGEKTDLIYYCLGTIESLVRMKSFYEKVFDSSFGKKVKE